MNKNEFNSIMWLTWFWLGIYNSSLGQIFYTSIELPNKCLFFLEAYQHGYLGFVSFTSAFLLNFLSVRVVYSDKDSFIHFHGKNILSSRSLITTIKWNDTINKGSI